MRMPFLALVAGAILAVTAPAFALPDLTPEVFDVMEALGSVDPGDVLEGCAGGATGRRLVRFSLRARNVGVDDLVLGSPGCPDCVVNPGAACANPLFECSPAHGHAHFDSFAKAELLNGQGQVVAEGRKYGFCLLDGECGTPQYTCGFQGLSAGCADVYASGLSCQYIDVTDVPLPFGIYTLRVTVDPDDALDEANEANNVVEASVQIGEPADCPGFDASGLPAAIPDQGTLESTIVSTVPGQVTRVAVAFAGTHPFVGDLQVTLRSPMGTEAVVLNRACGGDQNFNLEYDDLATDEIACPLIGRYPPVQAFAAFDGEPAAGAWTLVVTDAAAANEGALTSWRLELCGNCGNGVVEGEEACDDGNQSDGDCCAADCSAITPDASPCDDGNACTTADACAAGECVGGPPLTCDPCLTCDATLGCTPPVGLPCVDAADGGATLKVRRRGTKKDSLLWRWTTSATTTLDEFGSPTTSTDLALCVFDAGGLLVSATVPGGETCGAEPCWEMRASDLRYLDRALTPDGIFRAVLRGGDPHEGRVTVLGKGLNLALPPLGWQVPLTVRLRRLDSPACWTSRFVEFTVDRETRLRAVSE